MFTLLSWAAAYCLLTHEVIFNFQLFTNRRYPRYAYTIRQTEFSRHRHYDDSG
jgi:hypothetical protein